MNSATSLPRSKDGYTIIELVVAVAIISLITAIAIPAFKQYRQAARVAAFSSDMQKMSIAGQQYALESGSWLPGTSPGVYPVQLEGYISRMSFERATPFGGNWDYGNYYTGDTDYFLSIVGVVNPTIGEETIVELDREIDDGNLSTGFFRKTDGGYYFIIED